MHRYIPDAREGRIFSVVPTDSSRGSGHKWKSRRCSQHKKIGFYCQGGQALAQVAQVVGCSSGERLKTNACSPEHPTVADLEQSGWTDGHLQLKKF